MPGRTPVVALRNSQEVMDFCEMVMEMSWSFVVKNLWQP